MAQLKVKMRVNIFTDFNVSLNPYILLFKEALKNQGLAVKIEYNLNLFWLVFKSKSCDCIHLHWIKYQYSPSKKIEKFKLLSKLLEIRILRIIFDLFSLVDFVLSLLLAKAAGKIIVFTVHDLHDYGIKSSRLKLQKKLARKIVFRYSDKVHVHNHYTKKQVEQTYNRKTGIYVIPHGNYIRYYSNNVSKSEARKRLNLNNDNFVYLFLGLIRPYKGIENLIETFLKLSNSNAKLLIAGRVFGINNYESRLEELTKGNCRIKLFLDFIPDEDIQIFLNACDVFVLPYKDITTSGAALLGMSFGKPIIAPNISSFKEVISAENGILYDTEKIDGLFSALNEAIKSFWSKDKIISIAHQYDWGRLGSDLANLYKSRLIKTPIELII